MNTEPWLPSTLNAHGLDDRSLFCNWRWRLGIAGVFVVLQVLVVFAFLNPPREYLFLWYCNHVLILFAFAILTRNAQMVKGLSYVGMLTQLYWILDFTFNVLGLRLSGATDFVFTEGFAFSTVVTVIVHLVTPLVALLFTIRIRPQPISLVYAWVYAAGLYTVTLLFAQPALDVNCVFSGCNPTGFGGLWDLYLWPAALIVLTSIAFALHHGLHHLDAERNIKGR
ncbi:MAG: hypothetical protein AAB955_03450 [Patescibacteria group bacterium]